jgi:hypothetical protein
LVFHFLVNLSGNPQINDATAAKWMCNMKTKRRTDRDVRKVTKALAVAGANLAKGAEVRAAMPGKMARSADGVVQHQFSR